MESLLLTVKMSYFFEQVRFIKNLESEIKLLSPYIIGNTVSSIFNCTLRHQA